MPAASFKKQAPVSAVLGTATISIMTVRQATCGFCGLLCDDLEVDANANQLKLLRNGCERSRAAFVALGTETAVRATPQIRGKKASLDSALQEAARILRAAKRPLVSGLDIDVEGMRATLAVARKLGAVVDHANSAVKYRNLHVLQESGWITTTLTEVRNRADVLILMGDGWHTRYPRFVERVVAPRDTLFDPNLKRRVIALTALDHNARVALPSDIERIELNATRDRLPILLSWLTAMTENKPLAPERLSGFETIHLQKCAQWLADAKYGVIVWSAADLDMPHAELTVHALSRWLRALNQTSRFAGLPLAGTDADLTSNAVLTWQSGLSFPMSFANGSVDFDPHRYAHENVLARGEADVLLWVSSLSSNPITWPASLATIVLGRADQQFDAPPEVFIPVGTPGMDASGHLVRTDKVVSLHLPQLRKSGLASVGTIVTQLHEQLI